MPFTALYHSTSAGALHSGQDPMRIWLDAVQRLRWGQLGIIRSFLKGLYTDSSGTSPVLMALLPMRCVF